MIYTTLLLKAFMNMIDSPLLVNKVSVDFLVHLELGWIAKEKLPEVLAAFLAS